MTHWTKNGLQNLSRITLPPHKYILVNLNITQFYALIGSNLTETAFFKARFKLRTFHAPNLIPICRSTRIIKFGSWFIRWTFHEPNSISAKRKPVNFPVVHLTKWTLFNGTADICDIYLASASWCYLINKTLTTVFCNYVLKKRTSMLRWKFFSFDQFCNFWLCF